MPQYVIPLLYCFQMNLLFTRCCTGMHSCFLQSLHYLMWL